MRDLSIHKLRILYVLTIFVFIFLCVLGFKFANLRGIWGDETHSLGGIQQTSYQDILLGYIRRNAFLS